MPESHRKKPRQPDLSPHSETGASHIASAFFDKALGRQYLQVDPAQMAQYKQTFVNFYQGNMGQLLELTGNTMPGQENPLLEEAFSILSSLERNKGPYYQTEDITPLFGVLASYLLANDRFISQIRSIATEPMAIRDLVNQQCREYSSVVYETALPLVKKEDGSWLVAEPDFFKNVQQDAISVLEVMRQDNQDKSGSNKYRFRQAEYVRNQDQEHPKGTRFSWSTTHWYDEPNFWAGHLRGALVNFSGEVKKRFANQEVSVVTISMGGIAKGTATRETDIDTVCYIFYKDSQLLAELPGRIQGVFAEQLTQLPFPIKEGEGLTLRFVNADTKEVVYEAGDGQFVPVGQTERVDAENRIRYDISSSEIGVYITEDGVSKTFIKPEGNFYKNMSVAIAKDGLAVAEITPAPAV